MTTLGVTSWAFAITGNRPTANTIASILAASKVRMAELRTDLGRPIENMPAGLLFALAFDTELLLTMFCFFRFVARLQVANTSTVSNLIRRCQNSIDTARRPGKQWHYGSERQNLIFSSVAFAPSRSVPPAMFSVS